MFYSSNKTYRVNREALATMTFKTKTPYSPTGFIENQALLKGLKYGCKTSDYNGCGWIAMWNLLRALGIPYGIAEIIRDMELLYLLSYVSLLWI